MYCCISQKKYFAIITATIFDIVDPYVNNNMLKNLALI
jgi:hypothetical protein